MHLAYAYQNQVAEIFAVLQIYFLKRKKTNLFHTFYEQELFSSKNKSLEIEKNDL